MAQRNVTLRGFRVDIDAYHVSRPSITGIKSGADVLLDVAIDDAASGGEVTLVREGGRWMPYDMDADMVRWLRARARDEEEDLLALLDVIAATAIEAIVGDQDE